MKLALTLVMFLSVLSAPAAEGALKLEPLREKISRITAAKPEPAEIGYFSTRCGALFGAICAYMEPDEKSAESVKVLRRRAVMFMFVGEAFEVNLNGKDLENVKAQRKTLLDHYLKEMLAGKRLNNDAFTPFIKQDIECATEVIALFESLEKTINEQAAKSGESSRAGSK